MVKERNEYKIKDINLLEEDKSQDNVRIVEENKN